MDANPTLIVTCDAGLRNGRVINYKEISDQAQLQIDKERVRTLVVDRKIQNAISKGLTDREIENLGF